MEGIRDEARLGVVLDDADDPVWLVPAIALTESVREDGTESQVSSIPMKQQHDCQSRGRATDHRFKTHKSVPDEPWAGQPS